MSRCDNSVRVQRTVPVFFEELPDRSVDAALVVPEEVNPFTPNQDANPFNCKP